MKTLAYMHDGETATVIRIGGEDAMRRRLEDLGFITGTHVECVLHAPAGDPAAYAVRGATVALRRRDAERIEVK